MASETAASRGKNGSSNARCRMTSTDVKWGMISSKRVELTRSIAIVTMSKHESTANHPSQL